MRPKEFDFFDDIRIPFCDGGRRRAVRRGAVAVDPRVDQSAKLSLFLLWAKFHQQAKLLSGLLYLFDMPRGPVVQTGSLGCFSALAELPRQGLRE